MGFWDNELDEETDAKLNRILSLISVGIAMFFIWREWGFDDITPYFYFMVGGSVLMAIFAGFSSFARTAVGYCLFMPLLLYFSNLCYLSVYAAFQLPDTSIMMKILVAIYFPILIGGIIGFAYITWVGIDIFYSIIGSIFKK